LILKGGSAGLLYNLFENGGLTLALGGEAGYAKYETKPAGTSTAAGKEEKKVFAQAMRY
jgi:hypothetical protein